MSDDLPAEIERTKRAYRSQHGEGYRTDDGEHPVFRLARVVREHDGGGMEWRERPFGRGAEIRVWLPTLEAAVIVCGTAMRDGMTAESPMQHLDRAGSTDYRGWQVVISVPVDLMVSARDVMSRGLPDGA